MEFKGRTVLDSILFGLAAVVSLVGVGYVTKLWSLKRNFFICVRSPRLACALGLLSTVHYLASTCVLTISSADEHARTAAVVTLASFPAIFVAETALIMTAVRLLVMYYPSERAKWGRFTKELPLTYGLACVYVSMEIAVWSALWGQDLTSVAAVVETLKPLAAFVTALAAAAGLGGPLRKVDDASRMNHDIRIVAAVMLGVLCLQAAGALVPMPSLARKYLGVALHSALHLAILWIRMTSTASVAIDTENDPPVGAFRNGGGQACDSNRLSSIMSFLPLREAFGEYCRKSLCSESFWFLQDVFEFQSEIASAAAAGKEDSGFKGFGGFLAIVNDYIKADSHLEVNIESKTKSVIMAHSKFKAYSLLGLVERKEIFTAARGEVEKMLVDNLLNKFLVSAQYKAVVDFDAVIGS